MAISKVQPMRPALDDVIDVLNMGSPDYPPVAHNGEATKTYYLDPDNGSDTNDGSTAALAVASFERCLELSNEENRNAIAVVVVAGSNAVTIDAIQLASMFVYVSYTLGTKVTFEDISLFNSYLLISGSGRNSEPDVTINFVNINNSAFSVNNSSAQVNQLNAANTSVVYFSVADVALGRTVITNSRFSFVSGTLTLLDSDLASTVPSLRLQTNSAAFIAISSFQSSRSQGYILNSRGSNVTLDISSFVASTPYLALLTNCIMQLDAATYTRIQNAFATPFTGTGIVKHTNTITEL